MYQQHLENIMHGCLGGQNLPLFVGSAQYKNGHSSLFCIRRVWIGRFMFISRTSSVRCLDSLVFKKILALSAHLLMTFLSFNYLLSLIFILCKMQRL